MIYKVKLSRVKNAPRYCSTVYLAGKITGCAEYPEIFEDAVSLIRIGAIAGIPTNSAILNPATLPNGMTNAQYMRICYAMIDAADTVVFLPNWQESAGAKLEHDYCLYTGKPVIHI